MLKIISWFIIGIIYNILSCFVFSNLCNDVNKKITIKIFLLCLFFSLLNCYTIYFKVELRAFILNITNFILFKIVYKKNIDETLLAVLFIFFFSAIGEAVSMFIYLFFLNLDVNMIQNDILTIIIMNILIMAEVLIMVKIPFIRKGINLIFKWNRNNKIISTLFVVIFIIFSLCVLLYPISQKKISLFHLFLNFSFIICIIVFVYGYFKQKAYNNKLISKYDNLLNYSKTYEKVINEKSKNQHEYKNQLLLIKGMIKNKDNKIIKYIDELLDQNDSDAKHEWLNNLNKIPNGGLRGLICYNIDAAVDAGLISYVSVSDDIANDDVRNIFENNLKDLSIIIGVYLSNAIEAALECDKKFVTVDLSCIDNKIVISISNTFKKLPNISKDGNFISTKGKGHGYGLSLVKDIVEKNRLFNTVYEINGIYFVQKIIIKK